MVIKLKRILSLIIIFLIVLCGCSSDNTESKKEKVQINMPTDNTVNGYRNKNSNKNNMPDVIDGIEVFPDNASNETDNNSSADEKNIIYCGNKNSKKFHKSTCGSLINTKEENKVYLSSKQAFLDEGYVKCKLCKP